MLRIKRMAALGAIITICWSSAFCQRTSFGGTAATYFEEIRVAAAKSKELWNYDLYAPILLADRDSRLVYSNMPDSAGILKEDGAVYRGYLPQTVNISNTSLFWSGRKWAMAMLPLSLKKEERINFLAHELFHRAQPHLGFQAHNPSNDHLDKKNGRMYLRLELQALKKALGAGSESEMRESLTDALCFRRYRRTAYPGADSTENMLELNEGVAEYTGAMMSGRDKKQMIEHFVGSIDGFVKDPSYIRSFAYQTIPVYGYLLSETDYGWNKRIIRSTDLSDFFTNAFGIQLSDNVMERIAAIRGRYDGEVIEREESAREEKIEQQLRQYRKMFLDGPHFEIPLERMNMSFEYQNITSLGDKGTVYPVIRITDVWGILDVKKGALMSPQWNKVTVIAPMLLQRKLVRGDGWELELSDDYTVQKDNVTGNYFLRKN